jgi:hypothetical protein
LASTFAFLRRHQLARPPLGADADFGRIHFQLPVLRLLGVGANGIGLGADLQHVVDGLGRRRLHVGR